MGSVFLPTQAVGPAMTVPWIALAKAVTATIPNAAVKKNKSLVAS